MFKPSFENKILGLTLIFIALISLYLSARAVGLYAAGSLAFLSEAIITLIQMSGVGLPI